MKGGIGPVSVFEDDELYSGSLYRLPRQCQACSDMPCTADQRATSIVRLCERGVNYLRDGSRTFLGFFAEGYKPEYDAGRKLKKLHRRLGANHEDGRIEMASLRRVVRSYVASGAGARRMEDDAVATAAMQADVVNAAIRDSLSNLGDVIIHDIMQLIAAAKQNLEYGLYQRYGDRWRGQSEEGTKNSGLFRRDRAAYFMLELAVLRLTAADVVQNPAFSEMKHFAVHKMFVKIIRPYSAVAEGRGIKIKNYGVSHGTVLAEYDPFHIPPLAVIDNAVKYAPDDSTVKVEFDESRFFIRVTIQSWGPFIAPDEYEAVLGMGARGRAAKEYADGAGIGLWMAKELLARWEATIGVEQDRAERRFKGRPYYNTRVTIRYPRS